MVLNPFCNAGDTAPIPGRGTKSPHATEQLSLHTTRESVRCKKDPMQPKDPHIFKKQCFGNSLAVQWLRLHLPNGRVVGSIPGQGAKTPHASGPENQSIKQKQYCNRFNKSFKNGPYKEIFLKEKQQYFVDLFSYGYINNTFVQNLRQSQPSRNDLSAFWFLSYTRLGLVSLNVENHRLHPPPLQG